MRFSILLLLLVASTLSLQAQTSTTVQQDTLPAYQRLAHIPSFKIQLADSSWYSKADLPTKKPILILYFSPDCGHCQLETEDLISKLKDLKDLHVVMITSKPYDEMTTFADHYKLSRFKSIKIGSDPQRLITNFYEVKFTPFSALYDRRGKLIKAYTDGIDWKELTSLL
jgi:peroxiredoxin